MLPHQQLLLHATRLGIIGYLEVVNYREDVRGLYAMTKPSHEKNLRLHPWISVSSEIPEATSYKYEGICHFSLHAHVFCLLGENGSGLFQVFFPGQSVLRFLGRGRWRDTEGTPTTWAGPLSPLGA